MEFTWEAYGNLLQLLKAEGYQTTDYWSYRNLKGEPCVILRHDIDISIEKAWEMANLEEKLGIRSVYFVLLASEFYNPATAMSVKLIKQIYQMGHAIGLHFDEVKYKGRTEAEMREAAERERTVLEEILDVPINSISMHRPSKETLNADWKFSSMINSYSREFFQEFKYISDSRMHWGEDVEKVIQSHKYNRLHILTHAFSYSEQIIGIRQKLLGYIQGAKEERYGILDRNFRDLSEFVLKSEI